VSVSLFFNPGTVFIIRLSLRFAIQFASASGATVIATSSSGEKLEFAMKLGAKYGIDYVKNKAWEREVLRIVGLRYPTGY
jgi:NADPH:quinone reductase-like Zn-dependent oxidoreductase